MAWLTNWNYRKPITVSNSGSSLTDFQTLVTVDTASLVTATKMRSDCGDIRFTDTDGSTLLDYWIESGINSSSTRIWIKIPSISNGNNTIYLYYGNSSATTISNGINTFIFYDNNEAYSSGTSVTAAGWTIPAGTSIFSNVRPFIGAISISGLNTGVTGIYHTVGGVNTARIIEADVWDIKGSGDNYSFIYCGIGSTPKGGFGYYDGASSTSYLAVTGVYTGLAGVASRNQGWIKARFDIKDSTGNVDYWVNGLKSTTSSAGSLLTTSFDSIFLRAGNATVYWDNVRIRKYTSSEPTTCVGIEEGVGEVSTVSWLTGWDRRKLMTISGSTNVQADYQMKLIVHKSSGTDTSTDIYTGVNINNDFSDLRFTTNDGSTNINYWIESYTSGSVATVWIKIPLIQASPCTSTIYLYYDNSSVTSLSDGDNTFILFDDFLGGTLDTGKWNVSGCTATLSGGIITINKPFTTSDISGLSSIPTFTALNTIVETRYAMLETSNNGKFAITGTSAGSNIKNAAYMVYHDQDARYLRIYNDAGAYVPTGASVIKTESYANYKFINDGTNIRWYINDTLFHTQTTQIYLNGSMHIRWTGFNEVSPFSGNILIDYIRIRKYISPEPTFSLIGAEEILALPAHITATSLIITPSSNPCISGSCTVTVDVIWTNTGGTSGSFTPSIKIDNVTVVVYPPLGIVTLVPSLTASQQFVISGLTTGIHNICPDPN